jgi:hypothetical protein
MYLHIDISMHISSLVHMLLGLMDFYSKLQSIFFMYTDMKPSTNTEILISFSH